MTWLQPVSLRGAFAALEPLSAAHADDLAQAVRDGGLWRLGAKLDGVLRNHWVGANGVLRDSCVYSVIAGEWPTVKTHLRRQMDLRRTRA